jgi:hypothetical protein
MRGGIVKIEPSRTIIEIAHWVITAATAVAVVIIMVVQLRHDPRPRPQVLAIHNDAADLKTFQIYIGNLGDAAVSLVDVKWEAVRTKIGSDRSPVVCWNIPWTTTTGEHEPVSIRPGESIRVTVTLDLFTKECKGSLGEDLLTDSNEPFSPHDFLLRFSNGATVKQPLATPF